MFGRMCVMGRASNPIRRRVIPTPANRKLLTTAAENLASVERQAAKTDFSTATRVVYLGGFDKVLKILKRVSMFSCACTVVGVPLLALTSNNPRMKGVQKWAVAFVVVSFGVATTVALHVMAKPYVCKLLVDSTGELLKVETMTMFGRTKTTNLEFSKVVRAERPWATFSSKNDPKTSFFVEEAPDAYRDQAFRKKLFAKIGLNI